MSRILIVDDEPGIRQMLKSVLEKAGYEIDLAENGEVAFEKIKDRFYDLVLSDIRMPGFDGFQFLDRLKEIDATPTVIMMTSYGSVETAVEAIRRGAYDYISKPFKADEVLISIKKAEERERLLQENALLRTHYEQQLPRNVIFESPAIKEVVKAAEKVAPYRQPVLITGESGVGKEIFARLIHEKSQRTQRHFVAINCAAIPENLLESELFGHAKGAFTDASKQKRGLLEFADGGTCFLDEISEMHESLQSKLLRFLEDGEIRRVGDIKPIQLDVRIISATNKDIRKLIDDGKFRNDLYYRLNVIPLHIPPIRERKEDIAAYAEQELSRASKVITKEAMDVILSYSWPGNFRELKNLIEKMIIFSDTKQIDVTDLPEYLFSAGAMVEKNTDPSVISLKKAIASIESEFIARALELTGGNRMKAAKLLEISPRALHYKLKEYNIS